MYQKAIQYIKQNKLAFWIALVYVIFGGVVACSLMPGDSLNGDWWFFGWLFTFPVNMLSTSYCFSVKERSYIVVLIIQAITFLPAFIIIAKLLRRFKK